MTKQEIRALHKELLDLILKKTNIPKKVVIEEALAYFVSSNLDLLTPEEREKFKAIILTPRKATAASLQTNTAKKKTDKPQKFSKLWKASLKTQGWITVSDPNLM